MIIFEMQDGMMCRNDKTIVSQMIDAVIDNIPTKSDLVFKWQLYKRVNNGFKMTPLRYDVFDFAVDYADRRGYKTTASVFDKESLDFLIKYRPPFIKIACQTQKYEFRKKMYDLIKYIPRGIKVIVSVESNVAFSNAELDYDTPLCCIPDYPATLQQYQNRFALPYLHRGISDHTIGLELYNKYKPLIFEKHFYLDGLESHDKDWAITPEQLGELFKKEKT